MGVDDWQEWFSKAEWTREEFVSLLFDRDPRVACPDPRSADEEGAMQLLCDLGVDSRTPYEWIAYAAVTRLAVPREMQHEVLAFKARLGRAWDRCRREDAAEAEKMQD